MKVKAEPGVKVAFPQLKDTIAQGIEIISGPVRDSIMEKDGRVLVQESYVITSFDSGVFVIPPMPIEIQQESYNNTLRTDPLHLIVNTFVVDQQKGNYDIVMPLAAPWTFAEILPYLLWTLLGIVVILLVVWIIKVRKSVRVFSITKNRQSSVRVGHEGFGGDQEGEVMAEWKDQRVLHAIN